MKKLASKGSPRKCRGSNIGAVGVTANGTPGERAQGSPHGSDARRWIDGNGVAWTSYLTLEAPVLELTERNRWTVVRVDTSCALHLVERTTIVVCDDLVDASRELAAWSHGLELPFRDYNAPIHETQAPVASWPL